VLNIEQLRELIVRPTLQAINLYSSQAEDLLIGTAIIESDLAYLAQVPHSVARGLWMCEQSTYSDLLYRLNLQKARYERVLTCLGMDALPVKYDYLAGNLYASCIFARLKYLDAPGEIPSTLEEQGRYWSRFYQTSNDELQIARYIQRYRQYNGLKS
jgi:hypothetical protein